MTNAQLKYEQEHNLTDTLKIKEQTNENKTSI